MTFKWPWQYEFPPFFTLQKTIETREKQLEAWSRLVIDYCQFHKIYTIDIADISNSELFVNTNLNRKLSTESIRVVFNRLEQKRHVDWLDQSKNRCHIYWRRPEEWASLIYEWAVSNGLLNTPCTLYEISQGDDVIGESFFGLDKDILLKSLSILVEQRRAQLFNIGTDTEGEREKYTGFGFLGQNEVIRDGDVVIIYIGFGMTEAVRLTRGKTLNMKYGEMKHEYVIGKRYGSRISTSAGYVYVLRPSADLWTRTLFKHTQILYSPDCSLIVTLLDIHPGSQLCECGTGSGSLTHYLAVAAAPTGLVHTHDVDADRLKCLENEFDAHGLKDMVTFVHRNVVDHGFSVGNCDGVFLDLPSPWLAITHAKKALSRDRGGRLVSFSPCIEQVQKLCSALKRESFVQIETMELVPRKLKVVNVAETTLKDFNLKKTVANTKFSGESENDFTDTRKRKADDDENLLQNHDFTVGRSLLPHPCCQPSHTGYLTCATLLPVFDFDD